MQMTPGCLRDLTAYDGGSDHANRLILKRNIPVGGSLRPPSTEFPAWNPFHARHSLSIAEQNRASQLHRRSSSFHTPHWSFDVLRACFSQMISVPLLIIHSSPSRR